VFKPGEWVRYDGVSAAGMERGRAYRVVEAGTYMAGSCAPGSSPLKIGSRTFKCVPNDLLTRVSRSIDDISGEEWNRMASGLLPGPAANTVGRGRYATKDSGTREEYASGMVRDTEAGKPRFDLLLPEGVPYAEQFLTRVAELLARGADKYGDRNWEKGTGAEELRRALSSANRHFIQWMAGETDEDHAAAVFFNLLQAETLKFKMRSHIATEGTSNDEGSTGQGSPRAEGSAGQGSTGQARTGSDYEAGPLSGT
jgi:hypothetical protein